MSVCREEKNVTEVLYMLYIRWWMPIANAVQARLANACEGAVVKSKRMASLLHEIWKMGNELSYVQNLMTD
jgi:hypothetical protein